MNVIGETIQKSNPELYQCYKRSLHDTYWKAHGFGLMNHDSFGSEILNLGLCSARSYMFHEIAELVYLENRKNPLQANEPYILLAKYLHQCGFHDENYTLNESIDILGGHREDWAELYTFGGASTDPTLADFIQRASSGASYSSLYKIEKNLAINAQRAAKALQEGISYSLMKKMVLSEGNSWIFNLCPSIFIDEKIGTLFLELSYHHNGPISTDMISRVADLKDFLVELSNLPDRTVAKEKLLLMIYFPEYARSIHRSNYPMLTFGIILMEKLSKWRYDIAMRIPWGDDRLRSPSPCYWNFSYAKDYYYGYKEDSIFDDFILMLAESNSRERLKEIFAIEGPPDHFVRQYKRTMIEGEIQGTIYSIIKDKYGFEWGPIDPLSGNINPEFENECMAKLAPPYRPPSAVWFDFKYIDIMSKGSVPMSRLAALFDSSHSMDSLVLDYCQSDLEGTIEAVQKIYDTLAYYCQPQKEYQKGRWNLYAQTCSLSPLFTRIWNHNIEYCNARKGFEAIAESLEKEQTDYLTKKFLLKVLEDIIRKHYSVEVAKEIDFTIWSDSLKNQLHKILDELNEDDDYRHGKD